MRWFTDADIQFYFPAAAAAMLLLLLVVGVIALWFGAERVAIVAGRRWIARGGRSGVTAAAADAAALVRLRGVRAVAIASHRSAWACGRSRRNGAFRRRCRTAWSLANWMRHVDGLAGPASIDAGASARSRRSSRCCWWPGASKTRAARHVRAGPCALWILYVPLLVPQVAFLFGAQVLLVRLDFDGALAAVVWAHLVFVLPYLFLSLADPWRALDPRYARTAASLGAAPSRVFFGVKAAAAAASGGRSRARSRLRSAWASICRRCSPATGVSPR